MKETYNHKLTDEEFLAILLENDGMYSLTAKAIRIKYGIGFTRQSVRERAQQFDEELSTIGEEALDVAETNVNKFLKMDDKPELQQKMTIYVLNNRGAQRGYGKHAKPPADPNEPEGYFEIGGKEFRF